MSEDRETPPSRAAATPETSGTPGAPVAETLASETEVLRAVERSRDAADAGDVASGHAAAEEQATSTSTEGAAAGNGIDRAVADIDVDEQARCTAISEVDTQLDMHPVTAALPGTETTAAPTYDDLPTAAPAVGLSPARDGEIRISADHPMAALYTQTPLPPDIRGNRGAGTLIALLGTVVFAALYLGVIALWIAPTFPPSQFLADGLMPWLTSWLFIVPSVAFFVALVLLVLIVGRAGWWAYAVGGFLVAALVWVAATVTLSLAGTPYATPTEMLPGFTFGLAQLPELINRFGLTVPAIAAAAVAREVTVWFGAWIGARGRRMKLRNAEALAEYDSALAEAQATQP
ncbi:hypothetical protein [Leucobacter luti]|uniref:hypothetical protein n=1 Tax=Leucobacter luti TaxID=340320 RepID=UPI001C6895E0|nr:hypothetical protein [Leucobacter luti]QYM75455.1 hypothetical protein K1X41_12590 [Leucobacter luti]